MNRYVALLRGVSPMNATMADLKRCFEAAGFSEVRTVISTGNVVFSTRMTSESAIERKAEAAMKKGMGRTFYTIVRPVRALCELIENDPFRSFRLAADAKRVVSFLRKAPKAVPKLPIELDGARILMVKGREVFSAYVPGPRGPVFMALIEKTFGTEITTRTWDTVKKCAKA
jgi:uncharacterized protein (DUF1697 family)